MTTTPYESTGRTSQKARTRAAIVDAARELLAGGVTPTVESAADAAEVSRTTAYRYFPNQRALLGAIVPEIDASSLLPDPAPEDPEERFAAAVAGYVGVTVEHEPMLRAQLRLALEGAADQEMPFRAGRVITWLEDALRPLSAELGDEAVRRLVLATRSAAGIEALVWLTDVAGLTRDEAAEQMRWTARALYRATIQDASSDH